MIVFALLVILALGFYTFMFVLCLFYWYESRNSPCPEIPSPPQTLPGMLIFAGHACYGLLANMSAFVLSFACRFLPDRKQNTADGPGKPLPPVLCLHGLWHRGAGWFYVRRAMAIAGFTRSEVITYISSRYHSAEDITPLLENALQAMEKRWPGEKPLLVGHSLGGLIIRCWLAKEGNAERIAGVLTLGTPHRGSRLAALAWGELGRSLLPSNPFFNDLEAREKEYAIPCVSLVTCLDEMVVPKACLVPPGLGWAMRLTPPLLSCRVNFPPSRHPHGGLGAIQNGRDGRRRQF
ncbi:alpha/beta hydrolase [Desulfovibrio sp. OttesenSCG-928-I05]|nr:alpha/beta hydrolase [Desulfovibrio sp. OttesenSCG-928-I05]